MMNEEVKRDYTDCSLDEMIRDKFQKLQDDTDSPGISPLFRKPNWQNLHKRIKAKPNDYSNYLNHMAKKRVQLAHRKLDLRRRLNFLRTVQQKVDQRFKIVADMIARLKSRTGLSDQEYRSADYPIQPQTHRLGNRIVSIRTPSDLYTIKKIESLVGELPPWLLPQGITVEYAPSSMPSLEFAPPNMPSLEPAPPTIRPTITNNNATSQVLEVQDQLNGFSGDYSLKNITIQIPNDKAVPRKITLNERFTL